MTAIPTQTPKRHSSPLADLTCIGAHPEGSQSAFLSSSTTAQSIMEYGHLMWQLKKKLYKSQGKKKPKICIISVLFLKIHGLHLTVISISIQVRDGRWDRRGGEKNKMKTELKKEWKLGNP